MRKVIITALLSASALIGAELNVYSARHYDADYEIYKKFEAQTGIKIKHTTARAPELIKRLQLEGKDSPADIFITADVSILTEAKNANILAPVDSKV